MSGLCQFASSSVFSDVGSVELLAFCFVGELVVKNQILKRERTCSGGRQGFCMGQAIRSLLCGVVSVGSLVGTNSWAQLPESAVIDPATLGQAVLDNLTIEKEELLKEELVDKTTPGEELVEETLDRAVVDKATLKEAPVTKTDFSVEALKQLSADAQSLLVMSADAVVSIEGGSCLLYTSPSPRDRG